MTDLGDAIKLATSYLLKHQDDDGEWREDFHLGPGMSGPWVTAYVGLTLLSARPWCQEAHTALMHAAKYIMSAQQPGDGWGYNHNYPRLDVDSTAHCIVFLHSAMGMSQEKSTQRLFNFQNPDGGFKTYEDCGPDDSWGHSHPDVTPISIRAILTEHSPRDLAVKQGIQYLLDYPRSGGMWPAYWWSTPLYSTHAAVALFEQLGIDYDRNDVFDETRTFIPHSTFDLALQVRTLFLIRPDFTNDSECATELVSRQSPDGSWASSPILRVTEEDAVLTPRGDKLRGRIENDTHRLFTTATALAALTDFACLST